MEDPRTVMAYQTKADLAAFNNFRKELLPAAPHTGAKSRQSFDVPPPLLLVLIRLLHLRPGKVRRLSPLQFTWNGRNLSFQDLPRPAAALRI